VLLIDVGMRGGFHPRWKDVVDDQIGFDADADVVTGRPAVAIADAAGVRPFYLLHARPCSSILRPNHDHLMRFPGAVERFAVEETRAIETTTLDDVAPVDTDIILKLDVEGAERAIIAGAARMLARTVLIETEVWLAPVYCGGALFHDLHADLTAKGFSLVTLRRCWWRDHGGVPHLITGDAVYVRASHREVPRLLAAYRTRRSRIRSVINAATGCDRHGAQRLLDGAEDAHADVDW
jgi:hypothetical protein